MGNDIIEECISCPRYILKKPQHGEGDSPYYVCEEDSDPKECKYTQGKEGEQSE